MLPRPNARRSTFCFIAARPAGGSLVIDSVRRPYCAFVASLSPRAATTAGTTAACAIARPFIQVSVTHTFCRFSQRPQRPQAAATRSALRMKLLFRASQFFLPSTILLLREFLDSRLHHIHVASEARNTGKWAAMYSSILVNPKRKERLDLAAATQASLGGGLACDHVLEE